MTNEEAINIMSQMIKDEEEFLSDNTVEAHKMAIKALEQESCDNCEVGNPCLYCKHEFSQKLEPCDDAISRQAVFNKTINVPIAQIVTEDEVICRRVVFVDDIENLPPVTPQQKYGKWIKHPEIETSTPEYLMFYECSECGDKQCFYKSDLHKKRFCNSCGAKMESEVRNEV